MIGRLNYKRLLLLAALPAFLLASCSQEETPGEPGSNPDAQNGEIRFEIGFAPQNGAMQTDAQTRVATSADTEFTSTWEDGDEIGIFAAPHGAELTASGNIIHNVKLTYTGGKWTADEPLYWPKDGTKLDFYAYHPYDAALTDPTEYHDFYVQKDQSASTGGKSHFSLSDVMYAKADNNGSGYGRGETVALAFRHFMAMIQVKVSSSMLGNYPPDALKVSLEGCRTDRLLFPVASGSKFVARTAPVTITMYPCPNDGGAPGIYAYRALVPPLGIDAKTALFRFEYGGNVLLRSQPIANMLYLNSGRVETFDMTFPSSLATVSSTVRLTDLFSDADLAAITHLRVFGEMTEADFNTIRRKMPLIESLDLGAATVTGDVSLDEQGSTVVSGNAIPYFALSGKGSLKEFIFPRNITAIGDLAFYYCIKLSGTLTLPSGVKTIGKSAFDNCISFNGPLTLPAEVTTIGERAFLRCLGFDGPLTMPEGLTTIGEGAFQSCASLTGSLTIPQSLTTIPSWAFRNCGFTSLTIHSEVTRIDTEAFGYCKKLKSITSHLLKPDEVTYGDNVFRTNSSEIIVYVPAGTEEIYASMQPWNSFNTFLAIEP